MKKTIILFFVIVSLVLVSCGAASEDYMPNESESSKVTDVANKNNQKIYYTVNYEIDSNDVNKTIENLENELANNNGYVESSNYNYSENSEIIRVYYIFRCPTEKLDEFILFIDNECEVGYKNISSTNITTQYASNEARIITLESSKQAYLNMLNKDNLTVSDVIAIQKAIEEIDTELTELNILQEKYDSLLDYSTITIEINKTSSFFETYFGFLGGLVKAIASIILYILPFGIITLLIIFLIIKISKKEKKQRQTNN